MDSNLINLLYISDDHNYYGFIIKSSYDINWQYTDLQNIDNYINEHNLIQNNKLIKDLLVFNNKTTDSSINNIKITCNSYTVNSNDNTITIHNKNNNIILRKVYQDINITSINNVLQFGVTITSGTTRSLVKTDNNKNIIVKSSSGYDEYYRMLFCVIL